MKLALILSTLLVLSFAGCVESPPVTTPEIPTNDTTDDNMTVEAMPVTVTVGDGPTQDVPPQLYTLSPKKLEFHVGMPVNLTLKNIGRGPHDLIIQGIEGAKIASTPAGQSMSVEFTPTETGTFEMYCTIGMSPADHKSNGMAGAVTVV